MKTLFCNSKKKILSSNFPESGSVYPRTDPDPFKKRARSARLKKMSKWCLKKGTTGA